MHQLADDSNVGLNLTVITADDKEREQSVFFQNARKQCGFGAAADWLLVSWFRVQAKCIMGAL